MYTSFALFLEYKYKYVHIRTMLKFIGLIWIRILHLIICKLTNILSILFAETQSEALFYIFYQTGE
jgi:hypothetical protein